MKPRLPLLASLFTLVACAGAPEDEPPTQPNPITGKCPPCSVGQTCVNGVCTETSDACGPSNCATGCCSDNHCVTGTSSSSCGKGGGLCDVCRSDETCDSVDHVCQAKDCDATNCKNGCCDGTTCRTTVDDGHCGSGGQKCVACTATQKCQLESGSQQCVEQNSGKYQVVLVSASVNAKKSDGGNWDSTYDDGCVSCLIGCCPPDVYAGDTSRFGTLSFPKMVASNTTSPSWNVIVGELDGTNLVGASVHIELRDEDPSVLSDDEIGTCDTIVTAKDVEAGMLTLNQTRGCATGIQSIVLALDAI